jgi:hypothetical protein
VFVVTVCVHVAVLGPAGWLALPRCAGRSSASRGCAAAGPLWRGHRARCLLCRARAWPWSQSGRYHLCSSAAIPTPSVGRHRQDAVCVRGRVGLRRRAQLTASARTLASRHHAVSRHGYDLSSVFSPSFFVASVAEPRPRCWAERGPLKSIHLIGGFAIRPSSRPTPPDLDGTLPSPFGVFLAAGPLRPCSAHAGGNSLYPTRNGPPISPSESP